MSNFGETGYKAHRITRVPLLSRGVGYHPLFKNVFTSMTLMMIGETIAEYIKHCLSSKARTKKLSKQCEANDEQASGGTETQNRVDILCECWKTNTLAQTNVDVREIGRLGAVGAFQGYYQHYYYTWLDKRLLGTSAAVVAKKVILDEIAIGPAAIFLFFLINGAWHTHSISGGLSHSKKHFFSAYLADLTFWPLVQTINFALIPSRFRVPYISFFMCLWNTYLCLVNFETTHSPHAEANMDANI